MFERPFTNEVIALARDNGWTVFHVHDQSSYENYRKIATGKGYPDLVLYRFDKVNTVSMLVVELKSELPSRRVGPEQEEWLTAFGQFIPTRVWRPSDWDEINQVLKDGPPQVTTRLRSRPTETAPTADNSLPEYLPVITNNLRSDLREQEFSRGELAELRRMDVHRPSAPTFWRLATRRNLTQIGGPDAVQKWASIIHGIAMLVEYEFSPPMRFGRALFEGGTQERISALISPLRFATLLAARGPLFRTLIRRAFRILASNAQPIYWDQVARLILNDGYNEDEAERIRYEIAEDYYRAESRATRPSN